MTRPLRDQVVVVVGASSGIGRETACQFARLGSSVVLAARSAEALEAAARDVEHLGARAIAVPTDVAEWEQVQRLCEVACEHFGRIDTWINMAAVSVYGGVAEVPVEEIRRVLDVDLMGQIHGTKAVLPILRAQGEGTIIGVSSVLGVRAVPLQVPYCAAKHGLTAFYDGLRMEERRARSGVAVSVVMPSSVNTPFYDQARSHLGQRPAAIPPVYQPAAVARAILATAERPRRHVVVGGAGAALYALHRASPALTDRALAIGGAVFRLQQSRQPDAGQGNLELPAPGDPGVHGRFGTFSFRRSAYTATLALHPAATRAAMALAALGVRRTRRRRATSGPGASSPDRG